MYVRNTGDKMAVVLPRPIAGKPNLAPGDTLPVTTAEEMIAARQAENLGRGFVEVFHRDAPEAEKPAAEAPAAKTRKRAEKPAPAPEPEPEPEPAAKAPEPEPEAETPAAAEAPEPDPETETPVAPEAAEDPFFAPYGDTGDGPGGYFAEPTAETAEEAADAPAAEEDDAPEDAEAKAPVRKSKKRGRK